MDKVVVSAGRSRRRDRQRFVAGELEVELTPEQAADKHIERRTVQPKTNTVNGGSKQWL